MDEKINNKSLASRCLALTGTFETGKLAPYCFGTTAGNFDGQGLSFGALQWNLGQGTLQPLFQKMFNEHREICKQIFGDDFEFLREGMTGTKEASLAFAVYIQTPVADTKTWMTWKKKFRSLGLTPEFQTIQTGAAAGYYVNAVKLCSQFGLWSERGRALMFDIAVQNGGISAKVKNIILDEFEELKDDMLSPEKMESARMRIIANRRAEAANQKWVEDVRRRKLCIAEGHGIVHGITYNLSTQFDIELRPF